jgi:hypothetical protein
MSPLQASSSLCDLSAEDVLADSAPSIKDHSMRHSRLSVLIGRSLGLPMGQIRMLRSIGWAHDIGGRAKNIHEREHKTLLRLEFTSFEQHGVKPSFHPRVCLEHAEQRIAKGLRGPLSADEKREPFKLYAQEFELLKGAPLSQIESNVLWAWWHHPLYSIEMLRQRDIDFPPEIEVVIRCNEQPWLLESDNYLNKLAETSHLRGPALKRLIAVVRAADILENGNNRLRRVELRGVSIEDLGTTFKFLHYKFILDGLGAHKDVISAVSECLCRRDEEFWAVLLEARQSSVLLPGDLRYLESCTSNAFAPAI